MKAAFARVVPGGPAITIKPMFGQMSAFVNGNMFCGIFGEELMVRLPDEEIAKVADGVVLLPITAGEIVMAYNLPDNPKPAKPEPKRII